MTATLEILKAAGAQLAIETIEIGEKVYLSGNTSGIKPEAWESLQRTKVFLKSPITTPFGGGYKSLNVTVRKTLGLYANVRPCQAYTPFVPSRFPKMDVVIVRENEEDLYAGIEYRLTQDVFESLKLISRPGSEKIVRYAFEYARQNGRKKVSCFIKDNIMKLSDGIFHQVFDEVGVEYPEIEKNSYIIDIGAARLADSPEIFDVIVTSNLYGDIISDIAAQISGSVGIGGSSNIGEKCAMFEAIHGSAPDISGKDLANPSGLLLSAIMMLEHIGQPAIGAKIKNAWLKTLEDGIHTGDIHSTGNANERKVGTTEFTQAIVSRLGQVPATLTVATYNPNAKPVPTHYELTTVIHEDKTLVGSDIFLDCEDISPDDLGSKLEAVTIPGLKLQMISNRGVKVYPNAIKDIFCTNMWRCRFVATDTKNGISHTQIIAQLQLLQIQGIDFIKTENLYNYNGKAGYSLAQGQ